MIVRPKIRAKIPSTKADMPPMLERILAAEAIKLELEIKLRWTVGSCREGNENTAIVASDPLSTSLTMSMECVLSPLI